MVNADLFGDFLLIYESRYIDKLRGWSDSETAQKCDAAEIASNRNAGDMDGWWAALATARARAVGERQCNRTIGRGAPSTNTEFWHILVT